MTDEDDETDVQLIPPPLCWYDQVNSSESVQSIANDENENRKKLNSFDTSSDLDNTSNEACHEIAADSEDSSYPIQNGTKSKLVVDPKGMLLSTPQPLEGMMKSSLKHVATEMLPKAAQELISASAQKAYYYTRLSYTSSKLFGKFHTNYSELGNKVGGYDQQSIQNGIRDPKTNEVLWSPTASESRNEAGLGWEDDWDKARISLPPFSSLPWVDRQLVKEWRTCNYLSYGESSENDGLETNVAAGDDLEEEEADFEHARTFLPKAIQRPPWENATSCYACRKSFGASRLRHHCRLCGRSYCQNHSRWTHRLPHLNYSPDVPERVCAPCKQVLESQNLAERIAWRMARCRDYISGSDLIPYFETGIDSVEDAAVRLTKAAIHMAKSVPLGAQAHVAVETLDILRKHGLKGLYGLVLRKEFMAAADLLCKAVGINETVWPLSVHELSAAIFYALAQHRAMRGVDPEGEHRIHALRDKMNTQNVDGDQSIDMHPLVDETDNFDPFLETKPTYGTKESDTEDNIKIPNEKTKIFEPVCDRVSDELLTKLLFYAPLALNFIYAKKEVDMQLLAAQQGWRLLYAHLNQDEQSWSGQMMDKPASALFVHTEKKLACLAIRGTATINDVVTDIRAMPVQFPDTDSDIPRKGRTDSNRYTISNEDEWTSVGKSQGLALCGMAGAAYNLFRENIDPLITLTHKGYRIRFVGHSLGGSVAALLGTLVKRHMEIHSSKDILSRHDLLHVYSYGSPACVDANLSDFVKDYVTNCVLHDDVIPRLTPTSIRALLKHLLYIRETWVKIHLADDLRAITERAKTAWAPKMRNGFTLMCTANPSVKVYKKLKAKGKSMKKKMNKGRKKLESLTKGGSRTSIKSEQSFGNEGEEDNTFFSDCADHGLVVEGDCFFETEETLIENSDEECIYEPETNDTSVSFDDWIPFRENSFPGSDKLSEQNAPETKVDHGTDDQRTDISNAVLLEETPLPRMYIPGKIVHLYTHRGGYRAAIVPRAFKELRRISMAGSMLNDHKSKSYYEALLECKSIRQAKFDLPPWTGFSEEMTCSCCASAFTWASTSDSEAQEARDRHNCRACGGLVCEQCSKNKCPVPDVGLLFSVRVCDRCYNSTKVDQFQDSSIYKTEERLVENTPKARRNILVDELAMKMPSITGS